MISDIDIEKRKFETVCLTHTWNKDIFVKLNNLARKKGVTVQMLVCFICADYLEEQDEKTAIMQKTNI